MANPKFKAVGNLASAERANFFSEVIGQKEAKDVIMGMFAKGRVRNAFLASGVPGIGKTTLLRILGSVVNCANPDMKTFEPCGECDSCRLMMRPIPVHPDYQEIDCGANGGVDNARRINDFSANKPRYSFRVIVLDEAQNMTPAAQDAILKNLEHPKPHVIYGIATTEPQKLRDAVRSRCVDLRLTPPSSAENVKLLRALAKADGRTDIAAEILQQITTACMNRTRDCVNTLGKLLDTLGMPENEKLFLSEPQLYISKLVGLAPWVLTERCLAAILTGNDSALIEAFCASENKTTLSKSILMAMSSLIVGFTNIELLEPFQQRDIRKLLKHVKSVPAHQELVRTCDDFATRVLNVNRYEIAPEAAALPALVMACERFYQLGAKDARR